MKISFAFAVLVPLLLGSVAARAQDDGPRQLGGAPALPPAPPTRPVPPPRQLGAVPVAPADSARRAVVTAPLPEPMSSPAPAAPVYAPTPAGQLPGSNSRPARFQVGLKNGMLYSANDVETKSPLFGHSYLLLDGRRRLEMAEVGFYEDETGHYVRTTLPGSSREATLRREKTGRISLYSITSTQYNSGPGGFGYPGYGGYGYGGYGMGGFGGNPYGGYRTIKTEYFSKDNGPIQNLTSTNLLKATTDNAGAQQLLFDSRRYQNITTASYVVGGGLLLAGLLQTLRPTTAGLSSLTYLALPVLLVPVVLQSKQASNQRQAIALYNATQ